jgi:hypothetical protein
VPYFRGRIRRYRHIFKNKSINPGFLAGQAVSLRQLLAAAEGIGVALGEHQPNRE